MFIEAADRWWIKQQKDKVAPTTWEGFKSELSFTEEAEVRRQLEEYLKLGQIQPSFTPFASPVILKRKKHNTFRLCIDFRD